MKYLRFFECKCLWDVVEVLLSKIIIEFLWRELDFLLILCFIEYEFRIRISFVDLIGVCV